VAGLSWEDNAFIKTENLVF
jgi:hypothetical protein